MKERTDIENIISESFEQFSVIPSEAVKQRIDRSMFFLNLFHFHQVKLFVGTGLFTVVTGVVLYFSLFNNSNTDLQNSNVSNLKNAETTIESINNEVTTENKLKQKEGNNVKEIASQLTMTETGEKKPSLNSLNNKKENTNNLNLKSEKNSVQNTENKSKVPLTKANNSIEQNTYRLENSKKIALLRSSQLLAMTKNNETNNVDLKNQNLITKNENIETNQELNQKKDIKFNESAEIVSNSNEINKSEINKNFNPNFDINSKAELNSKIIYEKMFLLQFDKFASESETYNMNLLTIDSALLKEYLKIQNRWFIDFYWMPSSTTSLYKTKNTEFENFIEQKNNAVQSSLSYNSFGLSAGFFKNNMMLKTGIGYTNLSDKYNYNLILNNPTEKINIKFNNNPYDFEQNGNYYNIDTVGGYYHYTFMQDSIIHLFDSTWVDITDSNIVNMYDSTKFIQYDSLKNKSYLNNYQYFEIPISIGYRFQYNNFEITPEVGIITGFLYKKEGINISNDLKNNETYIQTFPYKQFIISGTLAININYNISENLGIFIEPAYRQTIASVYKSSSIIQGNSKTFVIKFGIRKKF
ncbi:MAG: hypothetical protein A2046_09760 [Bacteroidetes bacterium GWA2_30_7]|nr:MAG: hypothetical protein A2046_09760 [Bacteroidetes bacterium GWA2_30_7]